ncbi:MAG TPA: insulinase family protein, partial [Acidobacteria bacterium]|nr:insulinase family protein [Acidobacteriota bacterium]
MKHLFNGLTMVAILWATATVSVAQDRGDIFPFPVTTFQLENGLQVVGVEYDSPGVVAFYTVVRAGSRNEVEPGFSGYAHFFEHMMFRGTERYPTDAYNAVIKRIGADSNAFTTSDWTAYYIVASSDELETIVDLESDRFQNLRYSEEAFRTEAGAILGEYNLNFSNPVSLLQETLN